MLKTGRSWAANDLTSHVIPIIFIAHAAMQNKTHLAQICNLSPILSNYLQLTDPYCLQSLDELRVESVSKGRHCSCVTYLM